MSDDGVGLLASILLLAVAVGCSERPQPVADPDATFRAQVGRQWELVRLGTQEIPPPPPGTPADSPGVDLVPGRRPTITFTADPLTFGGRSFCNGYGGPFTIHGDSLRVLQIMSSAVGCDSSDSLETRFFRGLRETRRFEINADSLVLFDDAGSRLLFVPADPSGPAASPP